MVSLEHIYFSIPWAYFNGVAQGCGGGILLHLFEFHHFKIQIGLEVGTNNFAELISLRHLLHFALAHSCNHLHIFGDSKIIINWFNNTNS